MWKLISIIILLEIILNFTRENAFDCLSKNPFLFSTLALHHVTNGFLLYGWLFNDKPLLILHIIFCIAIMLYWLNNRGFCDVTVYVNEKCGWDKTDHLRDILYYLGLKGSELWKNKNLHYVIISLLCSISIYKLLSSTTV